MEGKPFSEYFDPDLPTVSEIRDSYKPERFVDLNQCSGLTHENVADAILQTGRTGKVLYIPEEPVYAVWNRGDVFRKGGKSVPLNTPLRFKRYGHEVDVTKSGTSIKEIMEQRLTPRKAFRLKLTDSTVRKNLVEGSFRGIGWWDPKKRTHRITPFDVFAEGRKFMEFYGNEMEIEFQYADCRILVPSLSRPDRKYIVNVRVLPVIKEGDQYLVEWLMTEASCGCEDEFYKGARGKLMEDHTAKTVFKYANPEHTHCRHFWAAMEKAAEMSYKDQKAPPFLVRFPRATGLLSPWHALKTRTLIGDGKRARRPTKTEIGILCGKVIGYAGAESMFDMKEDL